jgi:hypothetical protein
MFAIKESFPKYFCLQPDSEAVARLRKTFLTPLTLTPSDFIESWSKKSNDT